MAGEALRCSYVVLSVGRYLNPALAVRNLNPGISPSPMKSGAFLPKNRLKRGHAALKASLKKLIQVP